MTDPGRAERLWLAIAVATLFLVSIGGKAEANLSASSLPPLSQINSELELDGNSTTYPSVSSRLNNPPIRLLSCFRRGFLVILASVIKQMPLPTGSFIPDFSPAPG